MALEGERDMAEDDGTGTTEDSSTGDVRKFLEEQDQHASTTTKVGEPAKTTEVAAAHPQRPMWKMEIFAGDEKITEQFELEEAAPAPQSGSVQPATQSGQKSWKGFLQKVFTGA
jgi:hypothetical protein